MNDFSALFLRDISPRVDKLGTVYGFYVFDGLILRLVIHVPIVLPNAAVVESCRIAFSVIASDHECGQVHARGQIVCLIPTLL